MEKISIIVPIYGVEKYIVKCVQSLIEQTYNNIEILLINDGTTDKSIDLIKKNFHDKRIKIFNKENEGQAKARNYALDKASGQYLFFVDGDDFILPNTLEDMHNQLIQHNCNLVICDYYKYYNDNNKLYMKTIPFYDINNTKCSVISMPGPVCKLFKKDFFDAYNIRFLEHHYFEDNAIIPFVCAISGDFYYIQKPYYYYLQRDGSSLNKSFYDKKWEDIYDALEHLYNQFAKNDLIYDFYEEIEYIYIEYLLHASNLKFIKYPEGHSNIKKTATLLTQKFPNWKKNKYYKKENIKYKIICNLFFYNKINIVNKLLSFKKRGKKWEKQKN